MAKISFKLVPRSRGAESQITSDVQKFGGKVWPEINHVRKSFSKSILCSPFPKGRRENWREQKENWPFFRCASEDVAEMGTSQIRKSRRRLPTLGRRASALAPTPTRDGGAASRLARYLSSQLNENSAFLNGRLENVVSFPHADGRRRRQVESSRW